ncbi:hypothetical protein PUN28_020878 [Cardiocondyla obscurior]|uniref:Uncharacterized protein n=1 Tax=Cardiocondyla obscurior TaxID=286306 RepID=A0AAW2E7F0_9HYME
MVVNTCRLPLQDPSVPPRNDGHVRSVRMEVRLATISMSMPQFSWYLLSRTANSLRQRVRWRLDVNFHCCLSSRSRLIGPAYRIPLFSLGSARFATQDMIRLSPYVHAYWTSGRGCTLSCCVPRFGTSITSARPVD